MIAAKLDPMPWLDPTPYVGGRIHDRTSWSIGYLFHFSPRSGYSQNIEDYQ